MKLENYLTSNPPSYTAHASMRNYSMDDLIQPYVCNLLTDGFQWDYITGVFMNLTWKQSRQTCSGSIITFLREGELYES